MAKGRKPKPTSLKILKGTQPCRLNASEPEPAAGRPVPPARFREAVRAEWRRLCDELEALGVLNLSHRAALEIYCGAYGRLLIAEAALEAHGAVLFTTRGEEKDARGNVVEEGDVVIKSNPAAAVAAQCETIMTRILTEFGLTAASVSKVKAREQTQKDELADFLKAR